MKILGIKSIPIRALVNVHEATAVMTEPRVAELAKSIKGLVCMHEPMVRAIDFRLVSGRDRTAAYLLNGEAEMKAKLVDCTDQELDEMEVEENLRRRCDPDEQAALVTKALKLAEARIVLEERSRPKDKPAGRKVGRPVGSLSPQGKARAQVAQALNVSSKAIYRREQRAKDRKIDAATKAADQGAPLPPPEASIKTLGMDVSTEFLAGVDAAASYIQEAVRGLRAAQQALSRLKTAEVPFPAGLLARLYDDVHDAFERVKAAKPHSVCPHCKGLAGVQDECVGCVNTGFITEGQKAGVVEALWVEGDKAVVQRGGRLVSVWEIIERPTGVEDVAMWDAAEAAEAAAEPVDDAGLFGDMDA